MGEPKKKPGRSRKNGTDWELRRYVMLLAAVIVLILIGAVAMFSGKITNILGKKDGLPAEMVDTGGSGMVIEPDTKEYIQDFGGCILTENGEPGITELMNTYFQAVSDCDMDTFVKLFTSQDTSEEEHYRQEFEEQKQYISGYQNVKCYTTPGLRTVRWQRMCIMRFCIRAWRHRHRVWCGSMRSGRRTEAGRSMTGKCPKS